MQSSETASFQLLDIQDAMLKKMVETEVELRDECDVSCNSEFPFRRLNTLCLQERDGWYKSKHIESIKIVLRHKFFSLLEGHIPTEAECQTLLATPPDNRTQIRALTYPRKVPRHNRYNKAKGALPPEEAAVRTHSYSNVFI